MSDPYLSSRAADDFNRARFRATLSRIQTFLTADKDHLLSFNDVKDIVKPKNQTYQGMKTVPLNLIVGSEGRYRDFNKYFLPRNDYLRSRWESVDKAHIKDIILPPIQLYEIGGVYFVRDGNHRVSVARAQGAMDIDAEVTSLSSDVRLEPGMTVEELRRAVISFEKEAFYENTNFGWLTGDHELDFTAPGRYDVIYNHILVHKYYISQRARKEIPFHDALVSWYEGVYRPIIDIIVAERLYERFPGRTPSDLYVWIVKHWDFLKRKYGVHYSAAAAARDFTEKYGEETPFPYRAMAFFRALGLKLRRLFARHGNGSE